MLMSNSFLKKGLLFLSFLLLAASYGGNDPVLTGLVDEALKNSPEIQASQARIEAAKLRIPQVKSLPDPMFMFGYQNEGFDRYTYGEMSGSQWMFSASQQFLFPGKRALKGEMAARDAESMEAMHELLKLKTIARVKELYFDLFLAYKNIDLLKDKRDLFIRIENITLARYAAGKAMQQEVLMAQTEKYMLMEKEEMLKQKIQSLEAMLMAAIGRDKGQLERPNEPVYQPFPLEIDEAVDLALKHSPEIKSRSKMIEAADTKLLMAQKEYLPDFALSGSYFNRSGDFKDMWSATATINIPLYFYSKQRPAALEAKANVRQAKQELEAVKLMIAAALRDNYSMLRSAEKLMNIYKNGLIPKNTQDFEQSLTGYSTGKTEAINVISRLKTLLDYEAQYWSQFVEREKAIARLHAITEGLAAGGDKK
ncbi:TolC family protein [Candidatus Bathyarchaeota archaeon]|nr:TolC family protein [Candidatus Bathyarchaeota archaeon]